MRGHDPESMLFAMMLPRSVDSAADAPRNDGRGYMFRPSIGVMVSFASSMPSMQLTLSATTSVPSGLLPRANTSTPQSMQSWWRMACLLNRYSFRLSSPARS